MEASKPSGREEKWLTPREFGLLVPGTVSAQSIREWAASGKLPGAFRTPGGHWKIPESAVNQILAGGGVA